MVGDEASATLRISWRSCVAVLGLLFGITPLTSLQAAEDTAKQIAAPSTSIYRNIGGRDLRVFKFSPSDLGGTARPGILMVQGGAWSRGSPEQLFRAARFFSEKGFVSVVLEYRLADATNSPVESFSDVCHALAFMRMDAERLGTTPSRIAIWGISSSGQLAAAAATAGAIATPGFEQWTIADAIQNLLALPYNYAAAGLLPAFVDRLGSTKTRPSP